jgi:hypothetical protein
MVNFVDFGVCRLSSNGGNVNKMIKFSLAWTSAYVLLTSCICLSASPCPRLQRSASWFVCVEHIVDHLLKNNDLCYW